MLLDLDECFADQYQQQNLALILKCDKIFLDVCMRKMQLTFCKYLCTTVI